jgi:putative membrane-bound dehydrogenase-like protein
MQRFFRPARRHVVPVLCATVLAAVVLHGQTAPAGGQTGRAGAPAATAKPTPTGPRRIEVLFLGHNSTHHDSARFAPMLKAALAPDGFNFSYTADPKDLNAANLAQYDALMIYANHEKITPEQEKALLDFVAGGKAFLPIHSASFCFQNSPAYISLVGAQFSKHETGEFTAEITQPNHPVMAGMKPFQVWDETYVHTKINPDKTVLMERVDAAGREPWTWVRTHGKGRVFYTAYGHDERVWNNPNFHLLIKNALLWAVAPDTMAQLKKLNLQPVKYTESPVPVPNYERRPTAPRLQEALDLEEAAKHMQIPPSFELSLFASEPMLEGNPEAMAWDEKGRLWIAETKDYPNAMQPPGQGRDVIRILEDTNRDGKADKSTIFADKLSIVSSLVFSRGGIVVAQGGEFTFLKDTNGDDKADVRETIITGWGTNDTHALASNLKYGPDNWLWGTVGYSGFRGMVDGKELRMAQAVYRFSPDGKKIEHIANFTNNTWGLAFTENFDVFGSTANNEHSVYVAIPLRLYDGVIGLRRDGKKKIDGHYAMQANTQKIRQVDSQGGFTAVAGHNFYTARAFPEEYWNRIAFVNEPTGHVIHNAIIEKKGAGFAERDGWNLIASDDEWMAPVHAEVGPDGSVWFADFYDFIIQHNPTPGPQQTGGYAYQNGRGNAYDTPLREHARGRIYRLTWKGAKPYTPMSLHADRPAELVAALKNDNMFWRTTAQRLLVDRGKADVLPQLIALVNDRTVDKIGINAGAIHALYTMQGLGALNGSNAEALAVVRRALTHPSAGVRKAAQSVLPKTAATLNDLVAAKALTDTDLNVRLNAILTIAELPASAEAGRVIYETSKQKEVRADEWLSEAVYVAGARHQEGFLQAYAAEIGIVEFARMSVKGARGELESFTNLSAPGLADATWKTLTVPAFWPDTPLGQALGAVWFRRQIIVPNDAAGKAATLRLGNVIESDIAFINGSRVGSTTNQRNQVREYTVPPGVLLPGNNVVAIRVSNSRGRGGIVPDAAAPGAPTPATPAETGMTIRGEGFRIPIDGQWKYQVEETWEGGRRPEISAAIPIAQQYVMNNSPVAELLRPAAVAAAASAPGRGTGAGANTGRAGGPGGRGGPPPPITVALSVVAGENRYSQNVIEARPGQRVTIAFTNGDDMFHNITILKPNSYDAVVKDILAMLPDPTAQNRGYVPDSPNVLFSLNLVPAKQSAVLEFTAPMEPGEYPFICTFPGHWVTMRGVLKVAQ